MHKKILALLLIAAMSLTLFACGKNKNANADPSAADESSAGRTTTDAWTAQPSGTERTTANGETVNPTQEADPATVNPTVDPQATEAITVLPAETVIPAETAAPVTEAPATAAPVTEAPATEAPSQYVPEISGSGSGDDLAAAAKQLVGTAFEYGANGPASFDNSGLVYYVYAQNGIAIPRRTSEIAATGTQVTRENLQPGDIVIFSVTEGSTEAEFAGIYIGNDQFVASNTDNVPTSVNSMSGFWGTHFLYGRHVN